jgi:alkylation response protein AidB-like acyl-CoA dehydrogenase
MLSGAGDVSGDVARRVASVAARWRDERAERQARRRLERADFDELRETGLLRLVVPADEGGAWVDMATSTRAIARVYRHLAGADASVALVSVMHPAVLAFWLASPDPSHAGWEEQRHAVCASAAAGAQWGTITSEPGSGGDIMRTRATAVPTDEPVPLPGDTYTLAGDKHFGSGSGITDFMLTSAVPFGAEAPSLFAIDVRGRPWDGTAGATLLAEWDGMGMAATQSHALRFDGIPAVRLSWDEPLEQLTRAAGPFIAALFTAVVLGVLDEAVETARAQLAPKAESLRAFEQVEWSRAERDHWVAQQAFEGALKAIESGDPVRAMHGALRAKEAVAELAESSLSRLARVIGGGTFSRRSPFAHWFEDVRALGFLRPPWGLAFDGLLATSFATSVGEA